MKIVCDNQQEYDDLIEASKYLHDYDMKNGSDTFDQLLANGMVGWIMHLYREKRNEDKVPLEDLTISIGNEHNS